MRRFARSCIVAAAALAATAMGLVVTGLPAGAETKPIQIVGNVNIRPTPNTSQTPLTVMPAGSQPDYVCYTRGEMIRGTDVWFRVRFAGVEGYYTSYWDNVPLEWQNDLESHYGIHYCGTGTEINQMPAPDAQIHVDRGPPPSYDRSIAANWARDHATAEQPALWSGCTWFVSLALWEGGLPRTSEWTSQGDHGTIRKLPGTVAATAAPEFVSYMTRIGWAEEVPLGPDRFRNNAVPEARVGDVIAYDWDGNGGIDHLSIVTSISPGNYPNVAEWGTNDWPDRTIDYSERGWTWSQKHSSWLQQDNPDVTAKLLRIAPWA